MTATDRNKETLEALSRGDQIAVVEAVKQVAQAITEAIDAQVEETSPERVWDALSALSEELLAVLFPVIEYGDERALEVIPRALLHVGTQTSAALQETGTHRVGGSVALGRITWAVVAYAIHCGRFDAIADASRATVQVPFSNNETAPLIALTSLRYPDALGGNAGQSFETYRDWLRALPVVTERYPLFSAEFEDVFGEADLLLALLLTQQRGRVYSLGRTRRTVPRLARRFRDRKNRGDVSTLFAVPEDDLDQALERAYATLETDQNRWESPPATLFGHEED